MVVGLAASSSRSLGAAAQQAEQVVQQVLQAERRQAVRQALPRRRSNIGRKGLDAATI
jgi:hypothetical protein